MNFEEFKEQFRKIADLEGITATEEELVKLFIAQCVVNNCQQKERRKDMRKTKRRM
ncbi:hypothetical protein [Lysinibacillus fusiformis]|uniref:hypothetical protein n=1 Tax=Lysinibacillus fusiformis TaxID=28031 RepID=UPI0035570E63